MSNLASVFISFLSNIVSLDAFIYVLVAFSLFAVILLVRRVVYG